MDKEKIDYCICVCMYICTVEYYLAFKKEIPPFVTTWGRMTLDNIMLNEIRQTWKAKYCRIHLYVEFKEEMCIF